MTDQDYCILNHRTFREFWICQNVMISRRQHFWIQDSNSDEDEDEPQVIISTDRGVAIHLSNPSPRSHRKKLSLTTCAQCRLNKQKTYRVEHSLADNVREGTEEINMTNKLAAESKNIKKKKSSLIDCN